MFGFLKIVRLIHVNNYLPAPKSQIKPVEIFCRNISCSPQRYEVVRISNKNDRSNDRYRIRFGSICFLIIPVTCFGLGMWQIERRRWKGELIEKLKQRTEMEPVSCPEDLAELANMEYYPIRVKGTFDHRKELYVGPRSCIINGQATRPQGLMKTGLTGYHVVTPFKLSDRDLTILVNRGWVPSGSLLPESRMKGQVIGEVELVGIVRHAEKPVTYFMNNDPASRHWIYRDLDSMTEFTGASPVFIDAVESSTQPGGPVGGQTLVNLRNEHLGYIITWMGISALTASMWFNRYIVRI